MELRNVSGEIAYRTKTDRDGYYVFEQVAPGEYALMVSKDQLLKHGLRSVPAVQPAVIEKEGSFDTGHDFTISRLVE